MISALRSTAQRQQSEGAECRKDKRRRLRHRCEGDIIDPERDRAVDILRRAAVELPGDGELLLIAEATDLPGMGFGHSQRRQQQSR